MSIRPPSVAVTRLIAALKAHAAAAEQPLADILEFWMRIIFAHAEKIATKDSKRR
ncbi:MAG: hypothetical protein J2P49_03265 [Methylocapsa sp.]|nr:hypothetical protein [Methylocapsa sp.]